MDASRARLRRRERGQGAVEYAIALALVAVVVIAVLQITGKQTKGAMCGASHGLGWARECATAYIANSGSASVMPVSMTSNTAGAAVSLPGTSPYGTAFAPDRATVYVSTFSTTVIPISAATNTPGSPIAVCSSSATAHANNLAVTPDDRTLIVSCDTTSEVDLVDRGSGTVTPVTVPYSPAVIQPSADSRTAYVSSTAGKVVAIDLTTASHPVTTLATGFTNPMGLALAGQTLWVVDRKSGGSSGTLTPLNLTAGTLGTAITLGLDPRRIAVTPDGATAYVTNHNSNTVSVVNLTSGTVTATLSDPSFNAPIGVAVTADGSTAYVTNNGGGTVTPITVGSNAIGAPIAVGSGPVEIAITP